MFTSKRKRGSAIVYDIMVTVQNLKKPGPASSEEEHLLRKIVFSEDPSSNPASRKKTP